MFKVGQKVKRSPRLWKTCKKVFNVTHIEGERIYIQQAGHTKCPFTGELIPHQPMPYLASELISA